MFHCLYFFERNVNFSMVWLKYDSRICFHQIWCRNWPMAHSTVGQSLCSVSIFGRCDATEWLWTVSSDSRWDIDWLTDCLNIVSSLSSDCLRLDSCGRLPPTYMFHYLKEKDDIPNTNFDRRLPTQAQPSPCRLLSNTRVTEASHFQDVRLIEFDITGSNIE